MFRSVLWIILLSFLLSVSGCRQIKGIQKESSLFQREMNQQVFTLSPNDTFSQSAYGNWQLRLQGTPYELGYKRGLFTQDLFQYQEQAFFDKVGSFVPKQKRQKTLLKFLKWYHRDILKDIRLNQRQELYALSQFASNEFDFLGSKYERSLLLHGAHDIGHAMQDLMLVGCSSVALWNEYTTDGNLLIGRNFDFYVSEDFAKNKIIEFISPTDGYSYVSVSWPGMIGVVSGMNEMGLTVTLNAGKSSIPLKGKTPIALVAREILEKAQNIDEAIQITKQFNVFISESILIGSDQDNRAVNIEISPKKFDVFEAENGRLLCTNHFQSEAYKTDKRNQKHIQTSHSKYRLDKLEEATTSRETYTVNQVAEILRDVTGIHHAKIGLGNEKSLNQLLAHHAVIFKPRERLIWVSNNPYQLGAFEAYDLKKIFEGKEVSPIHPLLIKQDTLLKSNSFRNFQEFKVLEQKIVNATNKKEIIPATILTRFETSNPDFWLTYKILGNYYESQKDWENTIKYYEISLSKEVSSQKYRDTLEDKLHNAKRKK